MNYKLCSGLFFFLLLSGCSLIPQQNEKYLVDIPTTVDGRNKQMKALSQWEIKGKIAFLQSNKRESANLFWQHTNAETQRLNLTTYLGINVLQLKSDNGLHTIEVDGEKYQGDDLALLIYQLTQLQLPTEALTFWLKGLPFLSGDTVTYDEKTQLPQSLVSQFNSQTWQINYQHYKIYQQHQLATKFTLTQGNLTIIISINNWDL